MVDLGDIVEMMQIPKSTSKQRMVEIVDTFCKKNLQPFIDKSINELAEYANAKEKRVFFKREKIADVGLFIAKKRYILSVWNSEGVTYNEPKLKIMGIDHVKSAYPEVCRKFAKKLIPMVLCRQKNEVIKEIKEFKKIFMDLEPQFISFPMGVSDVLKYTQSEGFPKSTPINARAAINYNRQLKKLQLETRYEPVANGDKIKFIYLKTPNPLQQNVIGFKDNLPKEFKLEKYIDRETQYIKAFLKPFSALTDVLHWNIDTTKATLEDFFI